MSRRPSERSEASAHANPAGFTLPSPKAVPKAVMAAEDFAWFDADERTQGVFARVDGLRTVAQIADAQGMTLGEAQLRIADLCDRGAVSFR